MPDTWGGVEYPAWMDEANCAGTDPEAFFPEPGGVNGLPKQVCGNCMVTDECRDYALANDEHYGIWGGTSEMERRQIRREHNGGKAA
jgi:WhiB family redox-sensing transcriptional regulator